jgi:hypothetical protein
MAGQPEPVTISWQKALSLLVERGYSDAAGAKDMLLEAMFSGSVGYYPRRAVSLETQHRSGLLDPETGLLRVSHRERPWYIRVILSDFDQQFSERRSSSTADVGKNAVAFLAQQLNATPDMKRDDAWATCRTEFPKLSKRGFLSRIWPRARENAGLAVSTRPVATRAQLGKNPAEGRGLKFLGLFPILCRVTGSGPTSNRLVADWERRAWCRGRSCPCATEEAVPRIRLNHDCGSVCGYESIRVGFGNYINGRWRKSLRRQSVQSIRISLSHSRSVRDRSAARCNSEKPWRGTGRLKFLGMEFFGRT